MAVILQVSTLLGFHQALVKRKYHLLYSARKRRRPGPKGPSEELIESVIEMKRRNPRVGCRKIAEQISECLRLSRSIRMSCGASSSSTTDRDQAVMVPSWLTVFGHAKDNLWSVDFFRCESILLKSYGIMVVMDVFTRRIVGFGVAPADLDGPVICRMFNRVIAKQTPPKYLSSDNDSLFRFHR